MSKVTEATVRAAFYDTFPDNDERCLIVCIIELMPLRVYAYDEYACAVVRTNVTVSKDGTLRFTPLEKAVWND